MIWPILQSLRYLQVHISLLVTVAAAVAAVASDACIHLGNGRQHIVLLVLMMQVFMCHLLLMQMLLLLGLLKYNRL